MMTSDSLTPVRTHTSGLPLVSPIPGADVCSACLVVVTTAPAVRTSVTNGASETGNRLSGSPDIPPGRSEGIPGCWGVLCERAMVNHPAGPPLARQIASGDAAFRLSNALSAERWMISGLQSHGSLVRMPTHQPAHYWRRQQGLLPACRLGFGRMGFEPTGHQFLDFSSFISFVTFLQTSISWSLLLKHPRPGWIHP